VLLTPNPAVLERAGIHAAIPREPAKTVPLWTDDYTSLLPILK
jgi:hypothetical protein